MKRLGRMLFSALIGLSLLVFVATVVLWVRGYLHGKRRHTIGTIDMKLTNDSYLISIGTRTFTERYCRDKTGWLKVSARGRTFRMTAEQVLNHVLPALAGVKRNLTFKVEHRESLFPDERSA